MKIYYSELNFDTDISTELLFLKNGHCWTLLPLTNQMSRYFGLTVYNQRKAYRLLDKINFFKDIEKIFIHSPHHLFLVNQNQRTHFFIKKDGFLISSSSRYPINLTFDARDIFNTSQQNRDIKIEPKDKNFVKAFWFIENELIFEADIISKDLIKINNQWQKNFMSYDAKRNSPPYEFYSFDGLQTETSYLEFKIIKPKLPINLQPFKSSNHTLINFLLHRLNHCFLNEYLPAGFPWFFERWYRDELVSLFFLKHFLKEGWFEVFIDDYLNLDKDLFFAKEKGALAADVILWLINLMPQEKVLEHQIKLKSLFENWLKIFYPNQTLIVPEKATWMDTIYRPKPIEISALLIKSFQKLGFKQLYLKEKKELQKRLFEIAKENVSDANEYIELYRPNIFLVYQLLPNLFLKPVWRKILWEVYEKIKLTWGGLASLATDLDNFQWIHTGENPKSYHNGDSWHFLNILAAKTFFELKEDYLGNKILKSVIESLLKLGTPGYLSELSDAKMLSAQGSPIQIWSMATLVNLLDYLNYK